jgi:hypothetical protein
VSQPALGMMGIPLGNPRHGGSADEPPPRWTTPSADGASTPQTIS